MDQCGFGKQRRENPTLLNTLPTPSPRRPTPMDGALLVTLLYMGNPPAAVGASPHTDWKVHAAGLPVDLPVNGSTEPWPEWDSGAQTASLAWQRQSDRPGSHRSGQMPRIEQ